MDTADFNRLHPEEYKRQTKQHWGANPCGSNTSGKEQGTREYFEEVEAHRYRTHPWILEAIRGFGLRGKRVLEIGYGMGTDHLAMARQGAILHGIDLTSRNLEVTRARLGMYEFTSELSVGDAENLPYADDSFDFVYSFGVVHHSPDTRKIVSEIHRILAPGGRCHVTVYHRNSVFFWWTVYAVNYLFRGGWRERTLEQQLSLIEYPNTNQDMVIRLYRKGEFAGMFRRFRGVRSSVRHLIPVDIAVISRWFTDPYSPVPLLNRIGRRYGWYVIVDAQK